MIEEYIRSSQMSTLAQELREELDSPITLTEIQSAIGKMKPGQSPRPRRLYNITKPFCRFWGLVWLHCITRLELGQILLGKHWVPISQ